jgi:hypothetical protein
LRRYPWLNISGILTWLADGIFGALVGGLFFAFLMPPEHVREYKGYELRLPFSGFMSYCCHYNIYQRKWLVLEQEVAQFRIGQEPRSLTGFMISNNQRQAVVSFEENSHESDDEQSPVIINLR